MSTTVNNQNDQTQKICETCLVTPTLEKIMKDIETDTEKRVKKANKKSQTQSAGEVLVNIMQIGVDEFKEKTGRNMTYSEMRQMYG